MAGAGAPDSPDPEGAGTCPEDVPSLKEIEQLLNTGRPSCNHVDEVWPNLFLGDLVTANNRFVLWKMGVTHVLNAAHGTSYSHGGQDFYGATIDYYGVPAHDLPSFDISQFFFSAAQFIHNALNTPGAKILVHCAVGVSRSASLVLAYLMINHHLPLVEAIKTVKEHRWISPNRGFLKHLQNLDAQLRQRKDWNKGRTAEQATPSTLWLPASRSAWLERGSRQVALCPAAGDSQQLGALAGAWLCSGRSHNHGQRFAELLPWPGECETDPCLSENLSLIQPECMQRNSRMLRTRDSSPLTRSPAYETPSLTDLQQLLWLRGGSDNHVDQVWPNIYVGDAWAARSKATLQSLKITHILNAADGPYNIDTGAKYYADLQIEYYGIEAFDDPAFDLSVFFYDAANFIRKALNSSGGKVFVHCAMGVSRSATLVLAFLMIHENMTLVDALKRVSTHRNICPNMGFLSQLRDLDIKLNEERKKNKASATTGP
ncbi:uncharacterized protein RBU47_005117 [Passerculus sandwichensis]